MTHPITARTMTGAQTAPLTTRIARLFRSATDDEMSTGLTWYGHAHLLCSDMARTYGVDVATAAGVMAALSPQNRWEKNVIDTRTALEAGTAAGLHTGCQVRKADAILDGADPLDVLRGTKERSFYANIVDPMDPVPVTIDRHAHDIAVGAVYGMADRGLSAAGRYANISRAYRNAAALLSREYGRTFTAAQVQAVVWQVHTGRSTLAERTPVEYEWETLTGW